MADVDVRALRDRLGMERPKFSAVFGVPERTLQDWEQGRRRPAGAALAYLEVIAADPEAIRAVRAKRRPALKPPSPRPAVRIKPAAAVAPVEPRQSISEPVSPPSGIKVRIPRADAPAPTPAPRPAGMTVDELLAQFRRDRAARG